MKIPRLFTKGQSVEVKRKIIVMVMNESFVTSITFNTFLNNNKKKGPVLINAGQLL